MQANQNGILLTIQNSLLNSGIAAAGRAAVLAGARPERAPRQDSADDPAGPAQRHDHLRLAGAPSRCPTESPNLAWKATDCGNDFGNLAAKMFLRKPARVSRIDLICRHAERRHELLPDGGGPGGDPGGGQPRRPHAPRREHPTITH